MRVCVRACVYVRLSVCASVCAPACVYLLSVIIKSAIVIILTTGRQTPSIIINNVSASFSSQRHPVVSS